MPAPAHLEASPTRRAGRGVATVELALVVVILSVLVFGMIDFGRALLTRHALTSFSREAANLASRGTTLPDTLQAVLAASGSYDLSSRGYVILTAVERDSSGLLFVRDQARAGGQPASSQVGSPGGGAVNLPITSLPEEGRTLFVAEVYLTFTPVTPIAALAGSSLPPVLYDVAFFY